MFENAFKAVDDILRKDAGCSTELDYVEQSSWVLFLKYLDDFETERAKCRQIYGLLCNQELAASAGRSHLKFWSRFFRIIDPWRTMPGLRWMLRMSSSSERSIKSRLS